MTRFVPPPPPDLEAAIRELAPVRSYRHGRRTTMYSLKDLLAGFAESMRGDSTPTVEAAPTPGPPFVWRYLDRVQGRETRHPLPHDLMTGLASVVKSLPNPLSTTGRIRSPRPFQDVDEFLAFVLDNIVRTEATGNRRNTLYPEGQRRSYSFRLPTKLKSYLEVLRPATKNPYTDQPFKNLSQILVFCVYVFTRAEPWRADDAAPLWRENRASTRPPAIREHYAATELNQEAKFTRVHGMSQIQVRLDKYYYQELVKVVELLAPEVEDATGHPLTMSGYWISAVIWAADAIDWSADPLNIKGIRSEGQPMAIAWQERAPAGLLLG